MRHSILVILFSSILFSLSLAAPIHFNGFHWIAMDGVAEAGYFYDSSTMFIDSLPVSFHGFHPDNTVHWSDSTLCFVTDSGTVNEKLHVKFVKRPNKYFYDSTYVGTSDTLRWRSRMMYHRLNDEILEFWADYQFDTSGNYHGGLQYFRNQARSDSITHFYCIKFCDAMLEPNIWVHSGVSSMESNFRYGKFHWEVDCPFSDIGEWRG